MARKRRSKPTEDKRSATQRLKDRYSHAREDVQLAGLIATTPEEALTPERADPALQSEQKIPGLDRRAINEGWRVPEAGKQLIVERLLEPFKQNDVVTDKDGNQITLPPNRDLLVKNASALMRADQMQFERDNPAIAGQAKGGQQINQQFNQFDVKALIQAAVEKPPVEDVIEAGLEDKENKDARQPAAHD